MDPRRKFLHRVVARQLVNVLSFGLTEPKTPLVEGWG
jgi:hypothetical protein